LPCRGYACSRFLAAAFLALALSAYATLLNAPFYDAEIEAGLNQYHRDTTAFINRPRRLQSLGISLQTVRNAIRDSNMDAGGRSIEIAETEYAVRGRGRNSRPTRTAASPSSIARA
jgi:hypothetical protein